MPLEETMKKTVLPAVLAIVVLVVSLTACDDFFSSGWGNPRDYKTENINLTANNLDSWLERTIGNPPLAMRVTEAILNRLGENPSTLSPADRARFQRAGITIAVEASGFGLALLNNAFGTLANLAEYEGLGYNKLKEILVGIQSDLRSSGCAAAESIAKIADVNINNGIPTFPNDSFVHQANSSEIAKTIMVLTVAEVEYNGMNISEGEWDNFDLVAIGLELNDDGKVVVNDTNARPTTHVLAAYLNLIANDTSDDDFLIGALRSGFFGNN